MHAGIQRKAVCTRAGVIQALTVVSEVCRDRHIVQLLDKQLCQNDGNALSFTVCITETLFPASKPVVISLLEEGEDPWIPDVHGLGDMAGDLSPGEPVGGGRRLCLAEAVSD